MPYTIGDSFVVWWPGRRFTTEERENFPGQRLRACNNITIAIK